MRAGWSEPPATAGSTTTWSPSDSSASRPPMKRTSSSLMYTLTNRRRSPLSMRRSLIPGWFASRSSMSALRLAPSPFTAFAPPVYVRRMVGIRTSMAIRHSSLGDSARVQRGHDGDLFLGHPAVDDSVGPELHGPVVIPVFPCAHEHVVGA